MSEISWTSTSDVTYVLAEPWSTLLAIVWLALGVIKAIEIVGGAAYLIRKRMAKP